MRKYGSIVEITEAFESQNDQFTNNNVVGVPRGVWILVKRAPSARLSSIQSRDGGISVAHTLCKSS